MWDKLFILQELLTQIEEGNPDMPIWVWDIIDDCDWLVKNMLGGDE